MYPTVVQSHDEELKRRVQRSLHERGLDRFESMDLSVTGGVVTIRGRFPSPTTRQRSLECCRHVAAVIRVVDDTEILNRDECTGRSMSEQPQLTLEYETS